MDQRADAHETGLDCDAEGRTGQPIVADVSRGGANGHDFRVRRGIACRKRLIEAAAHDLVTDRDDGADGDFAGIARPPRQLQGFRHQRFVRHAR